MMDEVAKLKEKEIKLREESMQLQNRNDKLHRKNKRQRDLTLIIKKCAISIDDKEACKDIIEFIISQNDEIENADY